MGWHEKSFLTNYSIRGGQYLCAHINDFNEDGAYCVGPCMELGGRNTCTKTPNAGHNSPWHSWLWQRSVVYSPYISVNQSKHRGYLEPNILSDHVFGGGCKNPLSNQLMNCRFF